MHNKYTIECNKFCLRSHVGGLDVQNPVESQVITDSPISLQALSHMYSAVVPGTVVFTVTVTLPWAMVGGLWHNKASQERKKSIYNSYLNTFYS